MISNVLPKVREWLVKIISDKQDEVIKLRTALSLIDKLLKQGSFKIASNLASSVSQPLIQGILRVSKDWTYGYLKPGS